MMAFLRRIRPDRHLPALLAGLAVAATLLLAPHAQAQLLPGGDTAAEEAVTEPVESLPDPLGRETPRGMVNGLISALAQDDYQRAASYLDLAEMPEGLRAIEGPELARALQLALDRAGGLLPTYQLSTASEGVPGDELEPDQDVFAVMRTPEGLTDLIAHLVLVEEGPDVWMVTPQSLALVQRLAGSIETSLIDRWTPDAMAGTRLAGAPLAHWIAMAGLALVSLLAARLITSGGFLLAMRLIPGLRSGRAHHVAKAVLLPLGLFLASLAFTVGSFVIGISVEARALVAPYIEIVSWLAIGWIVWRAIDATARVSLVRMTRAGRLGAVSVVTMVRRAAKILVVVAASIAVFNSLGIDLTGWIAAFGLGGLAFALGAQKTIEHFVGSLTLIADQPVRVGDFCQVDGLMGTVEDIGMRSTRLRTLDRTLVTIPNGLMSQARIENYASRDRFRFAPVINLVYETTPEQMRAVLWRLRGMLEADARVTDDPRRVRFTGFGPSSLDVEIFAYVLAEDYGAFLEIREELNLAIMEIVVECGSAFAFPSQSLYLRQAA